MSDEFFNDRRSSKERRREESVRLPKGLVCRRTNKERRSPASQLSSLPWWLRRSYLTEADDTAARQDEGDGLSDGSS